MPVSNSDFAKKLASYAAKQSQLQRLVLANEENEVRDQARQSAEAYWMLGWHEHEITSTLEDEGFPEDIVKQALKDLIEHAESVLGEGPFALFEAGQLVKLATGSAGVLKEKRAKLVILQVGEDLIRVAPEQIDIPVTASLTKAFQTRKAAVKILEMVADIVDETKEYSVADTPSVEFERVRNFPINVPLVGPSGGPVKLTDVESIKAACGAKVNNEVQKLVDTQTMLDEVNAALKAKGAKYTESIKDLTQKRTELQVAVRDQATKVLDAIEVAEGVTAEEYAYAYEFQKRFVVIQAKFVGGGTREEMRGEEFAEFYTRFMAWVDTQPEKFAAKIRENAARIQKQVIEKEPTFWQRILNIFIPRYKERVVGGVQAQDTSWVSGIWDQVVSWVSALWQDTEEIYSDWENDVKPEGEKSIQELDAFIAEFESLEAGAVALEATATLLSYSRKRR